MKNIKKGDKVVVAIEKGSNASRGVNMSIENIGNWTYEGTVISVGKKYITVAFSTSNNMKFVIDDNYRNKYTHGGADYRLYKTFEDVYKETKMHELHSKIREEFSSYSYNGKFSLEILEAIMELIKKEKEN